MKLIDLLWALSLLAVFYLADGRVTCYYGSWATYRYDKAHFIVDDIDPFLCDEVIYSFAGLNETSYEIMALDPYVDLYDNYGKGGFFRFTNLKQQNPLLKTTLSVGGWNEGSEKYSMMAANSSKRRSFVSSTLRLLVDFNFDGLNMDWEFPGQRGGSAADKTNYALLLQELRTQLDQYGLGLTVAVPAGETALDLGFDIPAMSSFVDYFHVMTYDYHGDWEDFTHHNSPLGPHPNDTGVAATFNVKHTIEYLLSLGADPSKLLMGLPTYGRCYTLDSSNSTGFYAPASEPGRPGPYSQQSGFMMYNEICDLQQLTNDWVTVNDPAMNEPYSYRQPPNIWCGYDDPQSIAKKVNYASSIGLGGVMVWSIDTDDFKGLCGRPNDLIKTASETFNQQGTTIIVNTTTTAPNSNTTTDAPHNITMTSTPFWNTTTDVPHNITMTSTPFWNTTTDVPHNITMISTAFWNTTTDVPHNITMTSTAFWNTTTDVPHNITMTSTAFWNTTTDVPHNITMTSTAFWNTTTDVPHNMTSTPSWITTTEKPQNTTTVPQETTTPEPEITTTTQSTTTSGSGGVPECDPTGNYFLPAEECDKYWQCSNGIAYQNICPEGLYWNQSATVCDFPANVDTSNCIEPTN